MPETTKEILLTQEEAKLLLDMAQRYADSIEFNPDAQGRAYEAWLLAGRIADLLESD